MTLSLAFDRLLQSDQPLDGLDALIWNTLLGGAESSQHPWNLGAFSTTDLQRGAIPQPKCRTVVLRHADPRRHAVDFYTDVRSDKVRQLNAAGSPAPVCWLFYDPASKIQLRLDGAAVVIDGDQADEVWRQTTPDSRASYLSIRPPGERVNASQPPSTADRFVTREESERGRENFRIVRTTVRHADWLYLRRQGHVRSAIDYDASGGIDAHWVVP
ncbi:pyridoxamine 5'-phosphate oxidase [Stieleria maiorica]|uniref:Pyridoxamine 5'-phosphate oxidase n=1 Tax=Stieleria maiorica TaxID=2795974 RepID=A0A5B9MNX7_9BACT|nr:pyridoxamine 5'-phosphate oxidase family protein [Stieleria maiorica]QEG02664.1 pyridoxamine 5'-phosphate oxidase [Stieleria maiorica]